MFKIMMLIKKRPDMTREQFIDYYDNRHVPFMHRILPQGAAVHRRNFVVPSEPAQTGVGNRTDGHVETDCDVIAEVFYEDLETAKAAMRSLADPKIRQLMEEDENKFILSGSIRRFVVEVHETVFRPIPETGI